MDLREIFESLESMNTDILSKSRIIAEEYVSTMILTESYPYSDSYRQNVESSISEKIMYEALNIAFYGTQTSTLQQINLFEQQILTEVSGLIQKTKELAGKAKETIKNVAGKVKNSIKSVKDFLVQLPTKVKTAISAASKVLNKIIKKMKRNVQELSVFIQRNGIKKLINVLSSSTVKEDLKSDIEAAGTKLGIDPNIINDLVTELTSSGSSSTTSTAGSSTPTPLFDLAPRIKSLFNNMIVKFSGDDKVLAKTMIQNYYKFAKGKITETEFDDDEKEIVAALGSKSKIKFDAFRADLTDFYNLYVPEELLFAPEENATEETEKTGNENIDAIIEKIKKSRNIQSTEIVSKLQEEYFEPAMNSFEGLSSKEREFVNKSIKTFEGIFTPKSMLAYMKANDTIGLIKIGIAAGATIFNPVSSIVAIVMGVLYLWPMIERLLFLNKLSNEINEIKAMRVVSGKDDKAKVIEHIKNAQSYFKEYLSWEKYEKAARNIFAAYQTVTLPFILI